jgi:hypothetical protein
MIGKFANLCLNSSARPMPLALFNQDDHSKPFRCVADRNFPTEFAQKTDRPKQLDYFCLIGIKSPGLMG